MICTIDHQAGLDDRYPLRFATGRCAKPARSVAVDRGNGRDRSGADGHFVPMLKICYYQYNSGLCGGGHRGNLCMKQWAALFHLCVLAARAASILNMLARCDGATDKLDGKEPL
jgi:hypothetical protein